MLAQKDSQLEPIQFSDIIAAASAEAITFFKGLSRQSQLNQLAVMGFLILITWGISKLARAKMRDWLRSLTGRPKWQLRWLLQIEKRLWLLLWVACLWGLYLVLQQITWPSRSYLIGIIARLGTAWLAVGFAARIVHNRFVRRIVTWGLWVYITLYYLNLHIRAALFLDSLSITFGDFSLSLLDITKALIVTGLLFAMARTTSVQATNSIRRNEDISPSMRVLMVKLLQMTLYTGAIFIGLKAVGFDLSGLAVLSGAIGVGLGFGLQKVVSNLVSGIIILLDKSIKPGDVISLGDTFGWINTLGARYASVVTRDGKEYLIPNEDLITNQVVNWSHTNSFVRLDIHFGTAYSDDPHQVRQIAIEAADSVDRIHKGKPTVCHIVGFGDNSVDYVLRFWIIDPTDGLTNVRGAVYLALWDAFKAHDISIPFPQREVRMLAESEMP
ncbi:mechanosensitive ion channel-like protein [Pacificibacter maritimus]|uniref:Mechanosensitive ion channel-like protein n=1 Tax=Pacificibacter maritimus TaxID=762213 RepID=A0A3N4UQZ7_9RHOB|nr:mechanosensitive ion channel-like protein [Pacificibacter maritimus]